MCIYCWGFVVRRVDARVIEARKECAWSRSSVSHDTSNGAVASQFGCRVFHHKTHKTSGKWFLFYTIIMINVENGNFKCFECSKCSFSVPVVLVFCFIKSVSFSSLVPVNVVHARTARFAQSVFHAFAKKYEQNDVILTLFFALYYFFRAIEKLRWIITSGFTKRSVIYERDVIPTNSRTYRYVRLCLDIFFSLCTLYCLYFIRRSIVCMNVNDEYFLVKWPIFFFDHVFYVFESRSVDFCLR